MRNKTNKSIFETTGILLSVVLSCLMDGGCDHHSDEPDTPSGPMPQIIVLYSPGGLGDQGYNDCILSGIQQFKKTYNTWAEMYQYSPGSISEAQRLLSDWLALPESYVPALFVAAASDYEQLVASELEKNSLTPNKQLLLFETDNEANLPVTTFRLSMYGSSYLAGVTAAAYINELTAQQKIPQDVLILLAHPFENTIAIAGKGFSDGFSSHCPNATPFTEYLAQDWSGYADAQSAYRKMDDWARAYDFIFPVAGGSNHGIYRYTRENEDAPLTAGMDVDQSGLSRNITGSVIKHIDRLIFQYLETWLNTGELPESAVYGLESGFTGWMLSPYYSRFQPMVDAALAEAINKEADKL